MIVFSFWHHEWVMTDILSRNMCHWPEWQKQAAKKKAKLFKNIYVAEQISA